MGLVVDLSMSGCDVDPKQVPNPDFNVISNTAIFSMSSFKTRFGFRFDKKSGAPAPKKTELWRVGIVQNVLYEKMRFEYQGRRPIVAEFSRPAVDSEGIGSFPFCNEQLYASRKDLYGGTIVNPNRYVPVMVPFREVYYNPNGFGELVQPWSSFPDDVVLMPSAQVNAIDAPFFGCKLRADDDGALLKAEQIVTFGIWLVAMDYDQRQPAQVLAHVETFSLIYSVTLTPGSSALSYPGFSYFYYATAGAPKTASARLGGGGAPSFRVRAGGTRPLLKGETANNRDQAWANVHLRTM